MSSFFFSVVLMSSWNLMLLLLIVRSTGRGMSRQNGMCKFLFRVWSVAVCLWETWHCNKSKWKGNKINKRSCAFRKAIWDPCEIIWTGNWSSGGFGFFLRSALVHVHQGLELSQCSSRSDWWQLWSDTLDPSDTPHLTWSMWHFGQGALAGAVSCGRGLEWLMEPWLEVLDPTLFPALLASPCLLFLEEEGRDHEIHWNLRWPVSGKL